MSKNGVGETMGSYSLVDALFTSTQQRIYSLLFGQPQKSFYLTEIVRLADIGRGGVQRELEKLERTGLVVVSRIGNQKHYQANADSPLFNELVSIVKKTVGLKLPLIEALEILASDIDFAFIYGSVAKRADGSESDIDLLVVSSTLALEDIYVAIMPLESHLGRQVNPTLMAPKEFNLKRKSKTGFVTKILNEPIIELIGSIDGE